MKKLFSILFLLALIACLVPSLSFGETDPYARQWIRAIKNGSQGSVAGEDGVIKNLRTKGMPYTSYGVGTAGANVTATEYGLGPFHQTVLVGSGVQIPVTDLTGSTNSCGGVKIYDFPEGAFVLLSFQVDAFTFATNAVIDNDHGGDYAFGTTIGTGPDLTSTEIDFTDAKVSIDPVTNVTDAASALDSLAEAYFNGTATAKDLYVNVLLDGGDIDADVTNAVDFSATLLWMESGDL